MKNIVNKYNLTILMIIILISACKVQKQSPLVSIKKTQALILTQPFAYDDSNKDKVNDKYITNKKISIPKNLASQNKWIMFEGPVLENDIIAYRYYADARHRFDIYAKKVNSLVMDTVSWNYHDIMDWGSDVLKVGNSLGIGSPAILYQDSLYAFTEWDTKEIEIIRNENSSSMIRTTFKGLRVANTKVDLVQDWEMIAGAPWSEISLKVIKGELLKDMKFATGIVNHISESHEGSAHNMKYVYSWGEQSFHHHNMGMAVMADHQYAPKIFAGKLDHAMVFEKNQKSVVYRFMAAWSLGNDNIKDQTSFEKYVMDGCKKKITK